MKHTLLLVLAVISVGICRAQLVQIPNGSFEQWHSVNGLYEDPDFWTTNNTATYSGVVKDVNHVDSSYSMQIRAGGKASIKLDIRGRKGISFYWNAVMDVQKTDKVTLETAFFLNGQQVEGTKGYIATFMSWYPMSLGTDKLADTMIFTITGGQDTATKFNIDKIHFSSLNVDDISARINAKLSPNPIHQSAMFRFDNPGHTPYRWLLNDVTGRIVMTQEHVTGQNICVDRNDLPAGVYFWQLRSEKENESARGKLVIE